MAKRDTEPKWMQRLRQCDPECEFSVIEIPNGKEGEPPQQIDIAHVRVKPQKADDGSELVPMRLYAEDYLRLLDVGADLAKEWYVNRSGGNHPHVRFTSKWRGNQPAQISRVILGLWPPSNNAANAEKLLPHFRSADLLSNEVTDEEAKAKIAKALDDARIWPGGDPNTEVHFRDKSDRMNYMRHNLRVVIKGQEAAEEAA